PAAASPQSLECRRGGWLQELGITLLLDVGANTGQYARRVRRQGFQGRMVSFEPLADAFDQLQQTARRDRRWQCLKLALGSAGTTIPLNVSGNRESNSFLPMAHQHELSAPGSGYVRQELARVVRLDSLVPDVIHADDRIYLKLDVQGFETEVLKGARNI